MFRFSILNPFFHTHSPSPSPSPPVCTFTLSHVRVSMRASFGSDDHAAQIQISLPSLCVSIFFLFSGPLKPRYGKRLMLGPHYVHRLWRINEMMEGRGGGVQSHTRSRIIIETVVVRLGISESGASSNIPPPPLPQSFYFSLSLTLGKTKKKHPFPAG